MAVVTIELLDDVLDAICERGIIKVDEFEKEFKLDPETADVVYTILAEDGYVISELKVEERNKPIIIRITSKGIAFAHRGNYRELQRKEIMADSLNNSIVRTNYNIIKTNNIQRYLIAAATLFSAITLIITFLDYQKEDTINVQPAQVIIQQSPQSLKTDSLSQTTLKK